MLKHVNINVPYSSAGDNSSVSLAIVQAGQKDQGLYYCCLKNSYGKVTAEFNLTAEGKPQLLLSCSSKPQAPANSEGRPSWLWFLCFLLVLKQLSSRTEYRGKWRQLTWQRVGSPPKHSQLLCALSRPSALFCLPGRATLDARDDGLASVSMGREGPFSQL